MEIGKVIKLARRIISGREVDYNEYGLSREEYLSLIDSIDFLYEQFPNKSDSWILRAIIRAMLTKQIERNRWRVEGLQELGDLYGYYIVSYYEYPSKYFCTCYNTMYGYVRKAKICTHIAGVILYRRWRNRISYYINKP